ncbi:hypothetical protein ACF0H5_014784 [Mactra antiquata]
MLKGKKYDWKDSNMALFGSDTEKQVKKESAESEQAWSDCGQEVGLKIWRIEQFEVKDWPKEEYGNFYDGDSYIILNTYQQDDSEELLYDVHFWIGKHSSQDEYGTAAYKTVELDTFLDDKPVQHREVQGHESNVFKSYFKEISYLKGGADTGFNRVLPEEYTPRLFKVSRGESKVVTVTQIARKRSNVTSDDVFILDMGLELYQWNGKSASHFEKNKAAEAMQKIESERCGRATSTVLDEADISPNHKFYEYLNDEDDDDDEDDVDADGDPVLMKVSDADGSLDMEPVDADVSMENLGSDDVYIIDVKKALFVWIGKGASIDERKNAFGYAHSYLQKTDYAWIPVSVVSEGNESKCDDFKSCVPGCA